MAVICWCFYKYFCRICSQMPVLLLTSILLSPLLWATCIHIMDGNLTTVLWWFGLILKLYVIEMVSFDLTIHFCKRGRYFGDWDDVQLFVPLYLNICHISVFVSDPVTQKCCVIFTSDDDFIKFGVDITICV